MERDVGLRTLSWQEKREIFLPLPRGGPRGGSAAAKPWQGVVLKPARRKGLFRTGEASA